MLNKVLFFVVKWFAGRRRWQFLFKKLHTLSLVGMNYGIGWDFEKSGEKKTLNMICQYYRRKKIKKGVIFDVGANVGDYCIATNKLFADFDFTIYAFEPSVDTFNRLKINVEHLNHVCAVNIGLSNRAEKMILYKNSKFSEVATLHPRSEKSISGFEWSATEEVLLNSIDLFSKENKISKINLLKMDIEGHELKALEGASFMLNGRVDFIQFEFGASNIDSKTYLADFFNILKNNYSIFRVLQDGLSEVKYDINWEIFSIANYLAIHNSIRNDFFDTRKSYLL